MINNIDLSILKDSVDELIKKLPQEEKRVFNKAMKDISLCIKENRIDDILKVNKDIKEYSKKRSEDAKRSTDNK